MCSKLSEINGSPYNGLAVPTNNITTSSNSAITATTSTNNSSHPTSQRGRSSSGISSHIFGTLRDTGDPEADLRKIGSWNSYRIGKYLGLSGSCFFTVGLFLLYIFGDYFHHEVASVSSTAVAAFGLLQLALATVLVIYAFCRSLNVEMASEPM